MKKVINGISNFICKCYLGSGESFLCYDEVPITFMEPVQENLVSRVYFYEVLSFLNTAIWKQTIWEIFFCTKISYYLDEQERPPATDELITKES